MPFEAPKALNLKELQPDVLIVGSGAAGMTAAITAAVRGLRVLVCEAASTIGGTTAVSGGVLWVPTNDRMAELGMEDDLETALTYVQKIAGDKASPDQLRAWLEHVPQMARDVEEQLGEKFLALPTYPDYQPELPGGKTGGRSLDNALFQTHDLGDWRPLLRKNPITGRMPMTIGEAMNWGVFSKPFDFPYQDVAARAKAGVVHGGAALIGRSLRRALELGVQFAVNARVRELTQQDGRVTGALVEYEGAVHPVEAPAVLLASGGFEWNEELSRTFLHVRPSHPTSPPSLRGDALSMARSVGAELGNMSDAWWVPAVEVPGEQYDEQPLFRSEFAARCLPHSMIVNQQGQRFVNEALNYNDVVKPFLDFDPVAYERKNQQAWLVVDADFLKRYMYVTAVPGRPLPDYVRSGETLEELAEKCGMNPEGLVAQVARLNGFVETGVDEEFHRGEGAFERFYGDPRYEKNPNLGTIAKPPFCAVPIYIGAIGTKGGPKTDAHARVLHMKGEPIPGLYAAGNAQASPAGEGYPGAGSTISIAMTFGWLAARHIADEKARV